jgi:hypothetical protein
VYPCLSVASIICFDQPSNSNNVLFISSYCSGMEKNNATLCIDVLLQQVSCAVCFGCMFVHQLKMPPLISPKCMCWVWGPGHLGRIGSPVCVSGCHPHARVPNMYRATASAGCLRWVGMDDIFREPICPQTSRAIFPSWRCPKTEFFHAWSCSLLMNGAGGTSGPAAVGDFGGRNVIGMKPWNSCWATDFLTWMFEKAAILH